MTSRTPPAGEGRPRIAYEIGGEGPEHILFVAGLADTRVAWSRQLDLLGDRHTAITFDNRDVGESDTAGGSYSTVELAEDALRVLDAAGVESAHVVGHSLGGMVAQWLAIIAPERVRGLVLSCTYATPGPYSARIMDQLRRTLASADVAAARRLLLLWAFDPDLVESHEEELTEAERFVDHDPLEASAMRRQIEALETHYCVADLERISSPTTVIAGIDDRIVPARRTRDLRHGIPNAILEEIPGGHACFWTHPEVYMRAIRLGLDRVAA